MSASRALSNQLDASFGEGFSKVIDYEVMKATGVSLFQGLLTSPKTMRVVLKGIFRLDWVVAFVFSRGHAGLLGQEPTAEVREALSLTEEFLREFEAPVCADAVGEDGGRPIRDLFEP
jgi:hypothetical protein